MKLNDSEIQTGLQSLHGWQVKDGRIEKTFAFDTYADAVAFTVKVALAAEKADHHPDSLEIGWCKVKVAYVTHSTEGITALDLEAAAKVNSM